MEKNRALIVDDAYFMRNLIKRNLKESGYEIVGEAKTGAEGIKMYFDLKPDFVTMDINMPDMSGIEATREILLKDPLAKIIAVTANDDEQVKEEMIAAGALAYLKKPFQPAFLLTRIEELFSQPETPKDEETPGVVVVAGDDDEDEIFEHKEIDLLSESDNSRDRPLVIETDEDRFSFPDQSDEKEKYALTGAESAERIVLEVERDEHEIEIPNLHAATEANPEEHAAIHPLVLPADLPSTLIAQEGMSEKVVPDKVELLKTSAPEQKPVGLLDIPPAIEHTPDTTGIQAPLSEPKPPSSYLQIRPPRGMGNATATEKEEPEELGDLIVHNDEDELGASSKKGILSFITSLFKIK